MINQTQSWKAKIAISLLSGQVAEFYFRYKKKEKQTIKSKKKKKAEESSVL